MCVCVIKCGHNWLSTGFGWEEMLQLIEGVEPILETQHSSPRVNYEKVTDGQVYSAS